MSEHPPISPESILEELSDWERAQRAQISEQQAAFNETVEAWRSKHIFSLRDLDSLEPQSPLIDGNILFKRTTAWIAGQPGTYKSFIAIDWAMCIATGRPWLGRAVEQGRVLYIAGEGLAGMKVRARAWLHRHRLDLDATDQAIDFMGPTDLMDTETRLMLSHLASEGYWSLVVVDTQARALPGINENAKEELDPFIRFITHLAAERGATVLTVHHASLGGNPLRGSGSILGAADSVFLLTKEDGVELEVELKIYKQKETESGEVIPLTLVEHRFAEGQRDYSLVVDHGVSQSDLREIGLGRKPQEAVMRELEAAMLDVLERVGEDSYTRAMLVREIEAKAAAERYVIAKRDAYEVIHRAELAHLIVFPDGKAMMTQQGVNRLAWARQHLFERAAED